MFCPLIFPCIRFQAFEDIDGWKIRLVKKIVNVIRVSVWLALFYLYFQSLYLARFFSKFNFNFKLYSIYDPRAYFRFFTVCSLLLYVVEKVMDIVQCLMMLVISIEKRKRLDINGDSPSDKQHDNGLTVYMKFRGPNNSTTIPFEHFTHIAISLTHFTRSKSKIELIKSVRCDSLIFFISERSSDRSNLFSQLRQFQAHAEKTINAMNESKNLKLDYTIGGAYGPIMLVKFKKTSFDIFCDSVNCAARMAYLCDSIQSKVRICSAKKDTIMRTAVRSASGDELEGIKRVHVKGKGSKLIYRLSR